MVVCVPTTAVLSQTGRFVMRSSFIGRSNPSLRRSIWHSGIRLIKLELALTRLPIQCYSTRRKPPSSRTSQKVDLTAPPPPPSPPPLTVNDENNAFYVVRKGDLVGVFRSLTECQAQISSVCDPPVSVYKGYSLHEEAVEHLSSHGLRNASYVINAAHIKDSLFGKLLPCPFQQPDEPVSSVSIASERAPGMNSSSVMLELDKSNLSCVLKFDGASKGNPGRAGAGAILCSEDGSQVWKLCEGLGLATNNVAEYRALILGLKCALKNGFKKIHVQGDSKLVCMQMKGLWRTRNQNMVDLCKEAKKLKDQFLSFEINHFDREFNSEADALANVAINLTDGETREEGHEN